MNYLKLFGTFILLGGGIFTARAQTVLYVKANAIGANDGTSWTNAYTNLQSAITTTRTNTTNNYEIWVADGTFKPTHDPSGKASLRIFQIELRLP